MKHCKLNIIAAAAMATCAVITPQKGMAQTRYEGTIKIEQTNGRKISLFGEHTIINNESGLSYTDNGNKTHTIAADEVKNVFFEWSVKKTMHINYVKVISDDEAKQAYNDLRTRIGEAMTGIYDLRGGKEGGLPRSYAYEFLNTFGPDGYVQYFCVPHTDFPYSDTEFRSTYDLCKKFIGGPGYAFNSARTYIAPILNEQQINSLPELKALYLLLYDYAAIENVDLFGPAPYGDYKSAKESSSYIYDEMRNIYHEVASDIGSIVSCFKHYKDNRSLVYKKLITECINTYARLFNLESFTGEDMDLWVRFANSLKLRMAIHIAGVEPETAKKWAEEAVAGGVIESTEDEMALYPSRLGFTHPLVELTGWADIVMGASFLNLLQNLDHPYMKYLFTKNSVDLVVRDGKAVEGSSATGATAESIIVGMRNGVTPGVGQAAASNPYCGYSMLDKSYLSQTMPPLYLMKLSEVCFLRAEGAIRGWNMGGSAKDFYEQGIRYAGLEDRDVETIYNQYVDKYMNLEKSLNVPYIDPQGLTPDMESVTKIGVKWNDGDAFDTKLEKIITQKYIASFPYSWEAWVDLRRTGYPKLFPVLNVSDGDGTIEQGDAKVQSWGNIVRRIPWVSDDEQTKQDIENTGLPALAKDAATNEASDTQGQTLWWDVTR